MCRGHAGGKAQIRHIGTSRRIRSAFRYGLHETLQYLLQLMPPGKPLPRVAGQRTCPTLRRHWHGHETRTSRSMTTRLSSARRAEVRLLPPARRGRSFSQRSERGERPATAAAGQLACACRDPDQPARAHSRRSAASELAGSSPCSKPNGEDRALPGSRSACRIAVLAQLTQAQSGGLPHSGGIARSLYSALAQPRLMAACRIFRRFPASLYTARRSRTTTSHISARMLEN